MQSIYTVITKRFFRLALLPIFIIEFSLVITLFWLNEYQSDTNKQTLQKITAQSFQEISTQTTELISNRFSHDKSSLIQIQKMVEILFEHLGDFPVYRNEWHYNAGFYQFNIKDKNQEGFTPLPPSIDTTVYTTNLEKLSEDDYRILTALTLLVPSIKATVETQNDLISAAWINIDKHYSMAYPPINPAEELLANLDVTQYPFYYLADPLHNPKREAVFVPLYKESWAVDNGELGAYLMPIYQGDDFIGVIGLTLTAKAVADVIGMMDLPFNAYAMLVDKENHLIVSSDPEASYRDFHRHSFYELYLHPEYTERNLMKVESFDTENADRIIYKQPMDNREITLVIVADRNDLFSTINAISTHTVTIGYAFVVGIGIFYAIFFLLSVRSSRKVANRIISPLQAIVNFSSKLGRNEDVKLENSEIEELQELNTNLNQTHQKLLQMVIRDEATGLYNRHKLLDDLHHDDAKALMLFQLNNYKSLQNLYGNEVTDAIVNGVVKELKSHPSLQAYRIGDDDFAVLSQDDSFESFGLLFNAISSLSITYQSIKIHPFLFAGIAQQEGQELSLIEQAGIALLYAQRNIASQPVCYKDAQLIKAEFENNLDWTNRLSLALEKDLLVPYFQPIFNLETRRIEKFESLVRMIEGESVHSPALFLETAAATGKGHEITKVMIDKVLYIAAHYPQIGFTINISFKDFEEFDLVSHVNERCVRYGVLPEKITFELLETDALKNVELILQGITALKQSGFSIAIDDFGTGHSNFAHLMSMRVDYIKIDGQFIKNILKDPNSATITKTIAQFASLVGAKSVAEFVAEEAIIKRIRQFGISYAQGYAISPPLPQEQIATILHKDFDGL